ncbi:response regulator transcription factor [Deinococcus marmoris]|uniref:Phosphate regulon transcriptional regulatory protein PhoB (SphR) n=1 Tax=Deinococcus marmoris TaxID=249408 RepID=A0A1U7NWH7_9DEIO|nr:response regulator transcription factor [Deinococcus marmoris]OLV17283.1 Two-component system response regulator [Deinococcus marmoris]OLV18656.1 Phosphate regulon transcriptional regulatory protein PhoB (SphR) [Deinococcus marmoris]
MTYSEKGARTILVVDDEPSVRKVAAAYLEREGFQVLTASDGLDGLQAAQAPGLALVVLDVMLPRLDGLEICKRLRAVSDVPIILLTARGEELDRVLGLELGADDYMVKPFSPRELVARVKAVLRRVSGEAAPAAVVYGNMRIDPVTRTARLAGQRLDLSALEFDLLYVLVKTPGRVFTRTELIERVWGEDFPGIDRVVDVHMVSLRKQLGESGQSPRLIHAVRGVGYRFGHAE